MGTLTRQPELVELPVADKFRWHHRTRQWQVPPRLVNNTLYGTPYAAPGTGVFEWVVKNRRGPVQNAVVISPLQAEDFATAMVMDLLRQYNDDLSSLGHNPLMFTDIMEVGSSLREDSDEFIKPTILVMALPDLTVKHSLLPFDTLLSRRARSGNPVVLHASPATFEDALIVGDHRFQSFKRIYVDPDAR